MKKITEINIINYRAFYNEKETPENKSTEKYKIELKNGENLLVYGENGSGKSSLFKALQDFFETIQKEIDITENVYSDTTTPEPEIQITFSGDDTKYRFHRLGSDISAATFLQNISTSFLSYRDILRTYFLDIDKKDKIPNLFDLFVVNLLKKVTDSSTNTDLMDKLKEIRVKIESFDEALKELIGESKDKSLLKQSFEDLENPVKILVDDFNIALLNILKPVLKLVNKYLKDYFKLGFKISLKGEKFIKTQSKKFQLNHSETLFFNIELHKKKIENHTYQSFLNEARLSALAVCIYLAANKIESDIIVTRDLKILFLDDIFIGLDTTNRIPLLKLLESSDFKDWQVFITTYDRHWFELAKRWFNHSKISFKPIELYVDNITIGINQIESPLLIDNSLDYFEKANLYYKKKDYPASANYLRKACEKELKRILPQNLKLKEKKDTGELKVVEELGKLFENFKKYCLSNNLVFTSFAQFETYTKIIYNSLSHDDLKSPFYKKEIEEGIDLVLKLKEIQIKQIVSVENVPLTISLWSKNDATKQLHSYSIVLKENLYLIKQGSSDVKFSASLCNLQSPTGNREIKFQDALLMILNERNYLYPNDYRLLCKNIYVSNRKKLFDFMRL